MSNLTLNALGPYRLLSLLGVGGMAEVYRAHDPRLEREVAIKVLPPDLAQRPGFLERFRREARAIARLDHPHIMPIYDIGEEDGVPYVVMPLIEGGTLRDRIVAQGVCPLHEVAAILYQVALALQEAHQHGLVHRDVKPANILLAPGGRAVLADFGIVCALADQHEAGLTQTGMGIGTAEYMSPEQARGEPVDHRADVYALGIVLFQALTGRVPFSATDHFSTAFMQVHEAPPAPRSLNPAIPPAVEAIILKALAKEPGERFQSAAQFGAALAAAVPWAQRPGPPPKSASRLRGAAFHRTDAPAHASSVLTGMQQGRRMLVEAGRASWGAWQADSNSLTVPALPGYAGAPGAAGPAGYGPAAARSRSGRRWGVFISLVLVVLLIGGTVAAFGRFHMKNLALLPPAPAAMPSSSPAATATSTPTSAPFYMADFFELAQGDLAQGDRLGERMGISNNQYQALEGHNGTLFSSGAADRFGRAFGTGTPIRDQAGDLRFVVLVDRFGTPAQAQHYYQYQAAPLSQTAAVSAGEQAVGGLARVHGNQAVYRLIVRDRNMVVTFASVLTQMPFAFQNYFARLAQIIDQRGHRCSFTVNLKPVPGSPAICATG
jgi:hypothetical protein